MKQIYVTNQEAELILQALNLLGATDSRADDLADALIYEGRVSEV